MSQEIMNIMKKATCATLFLVRAVGLDTRVIRPLGFVQAYLGDKNHDVRYGDAVYLLFKSGNPDLEDFLIDLRESPIFLEEYYYEGNYIVVVLKILTEFFNDYLLFMEGKYSQFSEKFKSQFPSAHDTKDDTKDPFPITQKIQGKESFHSLIFNKRPSLRKFWEIELDVRLDNEAEVWSAPDLEGKELLDINSLGDHF